MGICHYRGRWFAHLTPVLDRGFCLACGPYSSLKVLFGSFLQLVESTPRQALQHGFKIHRAQGPLALCSFFSAVLSFLGANMLWN
jgi:hypothetical protein